MGSGTAFSRVVGIVGLSACSGALIGAAAATAMELFAGPFGVAFGTVVGLVFSPVLVVTLLRKPLLPAALIILPPSLATAVVSGLSENLGVTMLSVIVFCSMAGVAFLVLRDVRSTPRDTCPKCGYITAGLSRCPECDEPAADPDSQDRRETEGRRERLIVACAVALIGGVLPFSLGAYAAYDRHRDRTVPEWVERLGNNDMQIQWEAGQALKRIGSAPLIKAMSYPKAAVRRNAARALKDLKDPAARDVLTRALQDPDQWVRDYAQEALKAIDAPQ